MLKQKRTLFFKYLRTTILILLSAGCIGLLLLVCVYALPVDIMRDNVARGTEVYNNEGNFPELAAGYKSTKLDNDTDSTMLSNAIYPVTDIVKDALNVPMIGYSARQDRLTSLLDYANHVKGETYTTTYPRYWHGYLIILKPLLLLFDFSDIRVINMTLQFILFSICLILLSKTHYKNYLPAFIALIVIWNPITIGLSFQNSTCFYITLLALLYIIYRDKQSRNQDMKMPYFFLLLGIITVYFDFLTYPLVTLGIPLIFLISIRDYKLIDNIKAIFINSMFWGIGYLGMWLEKWLLASIILKKNIIYDGFKQIALRSSKELDGNTFSIVDCIISQISVLLKWPYLILFVGVAIFLILYYRKRIHVPVSLKIFIITLADSLIPYIILCFYPFIWFSIASNHCYANPKFTYRLLGISVFAFISGIIKYLNSLNKTIS